MNRVTFKELQANLVVFIDKVCDSGAPLTVTRQNARSVVILSEEEYDGLMETVHLLGSPANAQRLLESMKEANAASVVEHKLIKPKANR